MGILAIIMIVPFAVAVYLGVRRKTFGISAAAAILLLCAGAALMSVAAYIAQPGDETGASLHIGMFVAGFGLMFLALRLCYPGGDLLALLVLLVVIETFIPREYRFWYLVAAAVGMFCIVIYSALQAIRGAKRPPTG